jgi:hypothetical protein
MTQELSSLGLVVPCRNPDQPLSVNGFRTSIVLLTITEENDEELLVRSISRAVKEST